MGFIINADSSPDYDDWGWDDYWKVPEWQTFYDELVKKYGADEGSRRWLDAWHKQGFGANPLNNRFSIANWGMGKGLWNNAQNDFYKPAEFVPPAIQNQGQVVTNPQTGEQTQVNIQPDIEKLKESTEEEKGKFTWLYVGLGILVVGLGVTYFILKKGAKQ